MVRRRAAKAGIETAIGRHTFRATGITDYLTNGGRIEVAQRMAGHSNTKTTGLYDLHNDDISVGEVEQSGLSFSRRDTIEPERLECPKFLKSRETAFFL
jgi:integrase